MKNIIRLRSSTITFSIAILVLTILGHLLYSQFADYPLFSREHFKDTILALIWSLAWIIASVAVIYYKRDKPYAPPLAVLAASTFFIILLGIMFRGTEYGMNGHWGDNTYRMAMVCKMMTSYTTIDPYLKGMTSMYPPLWFYANAMVANLLNLEAYQTIKYGYFLVFLIYPWLLYYFWKPIVDATWAAVIAVSILFMSNVLLLYVYYEHITLALFVPWWLYYFENVGVSEERSGTIRHFAAAILIGAILMATYYWWFALAAGAYVFSLATAIVRKDGLKKIAWDFKNKSIITAGILLLSSFFWFPLVKGIVTLEWHSSQAIWFRLIYADLKYYLFGDTFNTLIILPGIFLTAYYFKKELFQKLAMLFWGGILLILLDRIANLGYSSIQTRKLLEFTPLLFTLPLFLSLRIIWPRIAVNSNLTRSVFVIGTVALMTSTNVFGIYNQEKYKIAVKQRAPRASITEMTEACDLSKVFLTNRYVEVAYLPYFMFLPVSNMTAHLFSRFDQREKFLQEASRLESPQMLSYALAHNQYDTVGYFYLPLDSAQTHYEFKQYHVEFNKSPTFPVLRFHREAIEDNDYFVKVAESAIYRVDAAKRTDSLDLFMSKNHPEVYVHLRKN